MARHRSPLGRRTHLGLPLSPLVAAAGAGGGRPTASAATLPASRVLATVLAGGALAAAGQTALSSALPAAADGADVLAASVHDLLDPPAPATAFLPVVPVAATVDPVADGPQPVDVSGLVKAAERYGRAAAAAEAARPAAPAITPAAPPRAARVAMADEVSMVAGRVTSGFGGRWGRQHRGLDIAAPVGTPIHAPLAGEVIAAGPASGFGLWVRVRHADGTVTTYGHVNRAFVRVGQHVVAGQEIAEVGNRGHSTGPHLHVEVQTPAGTTVNPRPWLDGHGIGY